jgi:hypothetical protein
MEDIWGTPNEKACHVEAFRREIVKLVEYFCTNVSAPLPSLIDIPIWLILSKDRDRPWCGSGKNMVAIDVSGRELPCTRYASMSFDQSLFDKPIAPDVSRCRRCWFKPACETCEALNWETNGNPDSRTSFHCEFIKWQAWGTAQAHSLRLQKRFEDIKASAVVEPEARAAELAEIGAHLEAVAFVLDQFEQHANLDDVGMMPVGQEAPESSF